MYLRYKKYTIKMEEIRYAVLQEMNTEELESWLTFIKINGNEENLNKLQKQLESVDFQLDEDLDYHQSAFDLEIERNVSEKTAKEMSKLDLNAYLPHRKFDGVLQEIDLNLKDMDGASENKKEKINDKNIARVNKILSFGQIENFIDQEDIDSDGEYGPRSDEDSSDDSDSDSSDSSDDSDSDSETEKDLKQKTKVRLPGGTDKPRFAKKAQRRNRR